MWSSKGSFSGGAPCTFKHMTTVKTAKETRDCERQIQQETAHCETRSQQPDRHKPFRKRKSTSLFQLQERASSILRFFTHEDTAGQVRIVPSSISAEMIVHQVPHVSQNPDKKGTNMISKKQERWTCSAGSQHGDNPLQRAISRTIRHLDPTRQSIGYLAT